MILKYLFLNSILFSLYAVTNAHAQPAAKSAARYPERPVRVIVPVAAGGGTDIIARLTVSKLSEVAGQPFKGGAPALTALLGGEVQLIFTTPPTVMPFIKSGRVKILGASGRERVPYLPDVPTLAEAGVKDFETAPWQGLLGPANLPAPIVDFLQTQIRSVLRLPETRDKFAASGTDAIGNTPAEFAKMIHRELEQNKKVIQAVGMRAD